MEDVLVLSIEIPMAYPKGYWLVRSMELMLEIKMDSKWEYLMALCSEKCL